MPCLNCGTDLAPAQRFCPHCGQRTDTARLSMRDVVRELMHSFDNIERSPLAFAGALLRKPGEVARDYVEGRRRRHYGPFATLTVVVGATVLALNVSGYQVLASDGFEPGPTELLQRHFNLLQLAQLPILGAICALLFHRARLNFFEHLVLAAYALSVRAAVVLIVVPVSLAASSTAPPQAAVMLFWAAWFGYFGWAASQFYRGGDRLWAALRGAAAAALAYAALFPLIAGIGRLLQTWPTP